MSTSFILAPGEELVQCPYNQSHQVTTTRLITHLDKCRRSYAKGFNSDAQQADIKICRHNASHHVLAPELALHENICKDRFSVVHHTQFSESDETSNSDDGWQQVTYRAKSTKAQGVSRLSKTETLMTAPPKSTPVESQEDWETESSGYTPGYDPTVKLQSEVVMYTPSGLTKSERKNFRKQLSQQIAIAAEGDTRLNLPTAIEFNSLGIGGSKAKGKTVSGEPRKQEKSKGVSKGGDDDNWRDGRKERSVGCVSNNRGVWGKPGNF